MKSKINAPREGTAVARDGLGALCTNDAWATPTVGRQVLRIALLTALFAPAAAAIAQSASPVDIARLLALIDQPRGGAIPARTNTDAGRAIWSMELPVPPGVLENIPAVTLYHGGGTGNGKLGVGGNFTATHSIHRCPPTIAQDGHTDTLRLTTRDRLCYDGRRLVPTHAAASRARPGSAAYDAAYWADDAVYATEETSGLRVSRMPGGFALRHPGGRVDAFGSDVTPSQWMDLGTDAAGRAGPVTWWLRRSADRYGNAIDYGYERGAAGEQTLLTTIRYGGRPGAAPPSRTSPPSYSNTSLAPMRSASSSREAERMHFAACVESGP
ncbi:MAG TPA: hypothetical protein VFY73_09075 [Ideonella sp.]|uniref:hypothetical protein n=1 Tax=Ideonella sp. TaxID=1929293 RepID=UPI002E2F1A8D|nr:hypothetical protein [Ideonella sp.]HEX5684175.1 hypothetical protein [Ideonella sp.]